MRPGELLENTNDGSDGYNGVVLGLRQDFVRAALIRPVSDVNDLDLLLGFTALLRQELLNTATTGGWRRVEISDTADQRLLFRALLRVCKRNKIDIVPFEYRDYDEFKDFFEERFGNKPEDARIRSYLGSIFNPIEDQVHIMQDEIWDRELAIPISPHGATGWKLVDDEILEMRHQFEAARSEQAHSSIGNSCIRVLQFLSDAAFVPERHLPSGIELPPVAKTKLRFDMIIDRECSEPNKPTIRKFARAAIELAEAVKHGTSPSRSDAGIAADSAIILVNLIRRLTVQEQIRD